MNQLLLPRQNLLPQRVSGDISETNPLLHGRKASLCLFGVFLFLLITGWTTEAFPQATVSTNKKDYIPGQTAYATGSGLILTAL